MFVFRKLWRAFFSWNTRFEIRTFTLLPTNYWIELPIEFTVSFFEDETQGCDELRGSGMLLKYLSLEMIHLVHTQHFPKN